MSQQSVRRIAVPNPGVGEMEEASAMCGVGLVDGVVEWGTGQENRGRRRLQGNSDVVVGVESTGVRPRPTLAVKPHELVDHIEATEAHRHGKEIDGGRVTKRGNIRSGPKDAMSCSPNRRAGQLSVPPLRCEPAGRRRQRAATSQPTTQDLLGPTPPGQPVGRVGDDRVHALAFEATEHSLSVTAVKVKLSHMLLEPSERLIMTMKIHERLGLPSRLGASHPRPAIARRSVTPSAWRRSVDGRHCSKVLKVRRLAFRHHAFPGGGGLVRPALHRVRVDLERCR